MTPPNYQLQLDPSTIAELRQHAGSARLSINGKGISLHYGSVSVVLQQDPATETCLWEKVAGKPRLVAKLGQRLVQQPVADEALDALQKSLASAKQAKQSNQTQFVKDVSHAKSRVSNHLRLTPSPTKSAIPAHSMTPSTSRQSRLQAIRVPVIHLLAIRSVSATYLVKQIACCEEELLEVLNRVAKPARLDATKHELSDRWFKELDLYAFPYQDDADRNRAKERAISAFDRMRLSASDAAWQRLLPLTQRGKGTSLSRLDHLQRGPIQQRAKAPRPRIFSNGQSPNAHRQDGAQSPNKPKVSCGVTENQTGAKSRNKIPARSQIEMPDTTPTCPVVLKFHTVKARSRFAAFPAEEPREKMAAKNDTSKRSGTQRKAISASPSVKAANSPHKGPSVSTAPPPPAKTRLGPDLISPLNLNSQEKRKINNEDPSSLSSKRQKPRELTPPPSASPSPPFLSNRQLLLQKAQAFKSLHATYAELHQMLSTSQSASPSALSEVRLMHAQLGEMKAEIHRMQALLPPGTWSL